MEKTLLSICIPAYNRPELLKRALGSIVSAASTPNISLEVIVTDDSASAESGKITQEILKPWGKNWQYQWNKPRLGMAANWNESIKLASGEYVLILHDDDFLLPGAVDNLLNHLQKYIKLYKVLLFGVHVVYEDEQLFKKQIVSRELYLSPEEAILRLMLDSSFVRFPAIAISKQAFEEVGYFDDSVVGGVADIEMWIRLFSHYGVFCVPVATSAYRIHSGALTTGMFNEDVVANILLLYDQVKALNILDQDTLKDCQAQFFHQFILGGTYRQLRQKNLKEATRIMELFNLEAIKPLKVPLKWLFIRRVFESLIRFYRFAERRRSPS